MTPLDDLRRKATLLKRAYGAGDAAAAARVRAHVQDGPAPLKHADVLHVIARETGFDSWPRLKAAVEAQGMDRAARVQRLKIAVFHGQTHVMSTLLGATPDLARGVLGLEIALYDLAAVRAALAADPGLARRALGPRRAILHLAFSRYHRLRPDLVDDMLAIAALLVGHGADVNDAMIHDGKPLSALYGALGHGDNLPLARWLLDHGADPNDGESLYHATELSHGEGLALLLAHGARPRGTNALARALDFDDAARVAMLLDAGADPNEGAGQDGARIPALHQAARRGRGAAMARLLLGAGADPGLRWQGVTAYALARVFGNAAVASAIAEAGGDTTLDPVETLLARAAEGQDSRGQFLDPARLPAVWRGLMSDILAATPEPGHLRRLAALGLEHDRPAAMGVPPVQTAGWMGRRDLLACLLELRPDLGHRNGHGGTLLGTIIHGSENAPRGPGIDHVACARLVLEHGLALPRRALDLAGDPDMQATLADWAQRHPGQVVEGGG